MYPEGGGGVVIRSARGCTSPALIRPIASYAAERAA